jgi:hypothetical protein
MRLRSTQTLTPSVETVSRSRVPARMRMAQPRILEHGEQAAATMIIMNTR